MPTQVNVNNLPAGTSTAAVDVAQIISATTVVAALASTGSQTVTPVSMTGIYLGSGLSIDALGANAENVVVTAVTGTTFTAVFTKTHPANYTVSNTADRQVMVNGDPTNIAAMAAVANTGLLGTEYGLATRTIAQKKTTSISMSYASNFNTSAWVDTAQDGTAWVRIFGTVNSGTNSALIYIQGTNDTADTNGFIKLAYAYLPNSNVRFSFCAAITTRYWRLVHGNSSGSQAYLSAVLATQLPFVPNFLANVGEPCAYTTANQDSNSNYYRYVYPDSSGRMILVTQCVLPGGPGTTGDSLRSGPLYLYSGYEYPGLFGGAVGTPQIATDRNFITTPILLPSSAYFMVHSTSTSTASTYLAQSSVVAYYV